MSASIKRSLVCPVQQQIHDLKWTMLTQLERNNSRHRTMLDVYAQTRRRDLALIHCMSLLRSMNEQHHAALLKLVALETLCKGHDEWCKV